MRQENDQTWEGVLIYMSDDEHAEQEPEVFAVEIDTAKVRLSRRDFVELAAASTATVLVVTGCETAKPTASRSSPSPSSPSPPGGHTHAHVHASTSPTPTKPPGRRGTVQPGHRGAEYSLDGETYVLRCGDPIPSGAVCTCNCVSVPLPGRRGTVPPGQKGAEYQYGGESYVLQCGAPIPSGAVCTCNCVTVPPSCSCVGYTPPPCSCDSDGCSVVSHYWYPN